MTRILTFGAFDLLHYGHMRLLERMSQKGSYLAVGLASDQLLSSGKVPPVYSYDIRREMLLHTRYVHEVVEHGGEPDGTGRVKLVAAKFDLIDAYRIDEVVMGDDWQGEYDFLSTHCRVSYLPRTPHISTTSIRKLLHL